VTDPHTGYRSRPEPHGPGYQTPTRAVAENRTPALTGAGGGM
jgi:hypothetical protein